MDFGRARNGGGLLHDRATSCGRKKNHKGKTMAEPEQADIDLER